MRRDSEPVKLGAWLAAAAIFAAPFVALLYRAELGLVVMAVALGATTLLLRGMLTAVPGKAQRWLRLVVALNLVLALACLLAAGWLATRT